MMLVPLPPALHASIVAEGIVPFYGLNDAFPVCQLRVRADNARTGDIAKLHLTTRALGELMDAAAAQMDDRGVEISL